MLLVMFFVVSHLITTFNEFQLAALLSLILLELFANDIFKYRRTAAQFTRDWNIELSKVLPRDKELKSIFIHFKYMNEVVSLCKQIRNEQELSVFSNEIAHYLDRKSTFKPTAGHTHTFRMDVLNILGVSTSTMNRFDKKSSLRYSHYHKMQDMFIQIVHNKLFCDIGTTIDDNKYGSLYAPNDIFSLTVYKFNSKTIRETI